MLHRRRKWFRGFIQECGDIKVEILNLITSTQGDIFNWIPPEFAKCLLLSCYLVKCCPFSGISAQHTRDQALALPAEKELLSLVFSFFRVSRNLDM